MVEESSLALYSGFAAVGRGPIFYGISMKLYFTARLRLTSWTPLASACIIECVLLYVEG